MDDDASRLVYWMRSSNSYIDSPYYVCVGKKGSLLDLHRPKNKARSWVYD